MKTLGFGFHVAGAATAAIVLALALHPLGCAQGEQALSVGAGGGATSTTGSSGGATTATSSSAGSGGAGGTATASSSAGTGGATTPTGTGGSEPDDAGSRDSGTPDSGPVEDAGPPDSGPVADAGSTACTVFETSIECMAGWTVIYVGTTGSTGGHFTYVSSNNCVSITDVNCNPTSSVGTSCDPTALGMMTVTLNPCDESPPCTVTFPVVCP